ncbi:MAG: autotransporter-associated beta strand repeat-containing protein [Planctomycetaceae bacterium]|nr:autotransporter-associated beta strand repeat-containing protein [Planctomycetaceae bacterium]
MNTSGAWNDPTKWESGTTPNGLFGGDVLHFGGTGATSYVAENTDLSFTVNGISLESSSTAANEITGGTINFYGVAPALLQTGSGDFIVDNEINFGTFEQVIGGDGTGVVSLNGAVGGYGFVKTGASTFELNTLNTYYGLTDLQAGTLIVNADFGLGDNQIGTNVAAGAQLVLNDVNYAAFEALTLAGSGVGVGALTGRGTSYYAGDITLAANSSIGSTGTLTLGGNIDGAGRRLTFVGGGTINVAGSIGGSGANSDLIVDGATLVLSGSNSYGGRTIVRNSGTLRLGASNTLPTFPLTPLRLVDAGSAFDLAGFNDTIARLSGVGTVTNGAAATTSTLTIGGSLGQDVTFDGVIADGAGRTALVKSGPGLQTLSGMNTYSGGTTVVDGGVLRIEGAGTLGADVVGNNVLVGPGGMLRLAANNLGGNQILNVGSDSSALGVLGIAFNTNVTAGVGGGGIAASGIQSTTSGVLALSGDVAFSTPVDLASLGDGTWYLGATDTNGSYTASSLGAGIDNNYRLGGGGGALTLTQANVLGGTAGLIIGSPLANGEGTVVMNVAQDYSGGTTINSGGTLQTNKALGLGTGGITLAGGRLALRADGSTVFGPSGGYDVTLGGPADSVSVIDVNRDASTSATNATFTFGELTIGDRTLQTTGANGYRVQFDGTTTLTGGATFDTPTAQLTLAGQILGGGSGFGITKLGAGVLVLSNASTSTPNELAFLNIKQGTVQVNGVYGASASGGADIILDNGTLNLRHDGDGLSTQETIYVGGDVVMSGAAGTIGVDRIGTTASQKTLELDGLTIAKQRLVITGSSTTAYSLAFNGVTTLNDAARIDAGVGTVLRGEIIDTGPGYTLNKLGGGTLYVNADNSNFRGGTVISAGTVIFGNLLGSSSIVYNGNATLGTGNVTVNPGAAVRFTALGNISAGQRYNFASNALSLARADLQLDADPSAFSIRSNTSGALALNVATYSTALDMARLGDGTWSLGAVGTSSYRAATLGAGLGNVYRFGAGGSSVEIFLPNVVTGDNSVEVGRRLYNATVIGNTTGTVVFAQDQNYTGDTIVHVGSTSTIGNTLDFRGTLASPNIYVFGRLTANVNGTFVNGDNTGNRNNVVLAPGAALRFDYTSTAAGPSIDKWHDSTPIVLNGSAVELIGRNATNAVTSETVGDLSFRGGSVVLVQESGTAAQAELTVASLTRVGQGTLTFTRGGSSAANIGQVGGDTVRFLVASGAPTVTNGIVAPYIVNGTDHSFMTYGADGLANAAYAGTLAAGTGVEVVDVTATTTLAAAADVYALRTSGDILGGQDITIRSGGLITTSTRNLTANLIFGTSGSPAEALIYTTGTTTLTGSITAENLTKFGVGRLTLTQASPNLTGTTIQVNAGQLQIQNAAALGTTEKVIRLAGSTVSTSTLELRANASTVFNAAVELSQDVPLAAISVDRITAGSTQTHTIKGLTFNVSTTGGQTLNITGGNTFALTVAGPTVLNGSGYASIITSSAITTLDGEVSGTAGLWKGGSSTSNTNNTLILTTANTYTGGTILNAGILEVRDPAGLGTGAITLNSGQLTVKSNATATATYFTGAGNDILINGNTTFSFQRISGSGAVTHTIGSATNKLTIGNEAIVTVANATSQTSQFAGDVVLDSNVTINASSSFSMLRAITETTSNAGYVLNKLGGGTLTLSAAAPSTYSGGTVINEGLIRVANAAGRLGTGDVTINAGGRLSMINLNNVNTAGGQQIFLTSNPTRLGVIGLGQAPASQEAITGVGGILPSANVQTGGQGAVLGIDGTFALALDMATLYDGRWFLGSANSATYTGASLGVGADDVYRIGGGGSTITILAASNNILKGSARLVLGKEATNGTGSVVLNNTNNYVGGTLVTQSVFGATSLFIRSGNLNTPLGFGHVAVQGTLTFDSTLGSAVSGLNGDVNPNANTYSFHPGAILRFGSTSSNFNVPGSTGGRWADTVGVELNGSTLDLRSSTSTTLFNYEKMGAITYRAGSDLIVLRAAATAAGAEFAFDSLSRLDTGTLTVGHTAGVLGAAANYERVTIAAPPQMVSNMLPAYIVDRTDNQYLQYDSSVGLKLIDTTAANTFYKSVSGTFGSALDNDGTEVVSISSTAATLNTDLDLYALRTDQAVARGGSGASAITIRSGGLLSYSASTRRIDADLIFGASGQSEALIYTLATTQIGGQISAGAVTKFGAGALQLMVNQATFTGDWNVNTGTLQVSTLGALGVGNQVKLFGGAGGGSTLYLTINPGTPDNAFLSAGKISVWDNNTIRFDPNGTDRQLTIGDIDLNTTGSGNLSGLRFYVDDSRNVLRTGMVTMNADYMINVDAVNSSYGQSVGTAFGGLSGFGLSLTKIGDGMLILPDIRDTFVFGTINIASGPLVVTNDGSLGSGAGSVANVYYGGALEIDVANFQPTVETLNFHPGSVERWNVEDARGTSGVYTLAPGQNLQLATNLVTGVRTIELNGGGVWGFMRYDDEATAVYRTAAANISWRLLADSFIGRTLPLGTVNFIDDTKGVPSSPTQNNNTLSVTGAILEINGVIDGNFDLTKVGNDIVVLGGKNTYRNTIVADGILRLGTDDALPTAGLLTTRGRAILDMNGFNQRIGNLADDFDTVGGSGIIENSAYTINTLTVGDAADSTYAGLIRGGINLTKVGAGMLTLTAPNTYFGDTTINEGVLRAGSLDATPDTPDLYLAAGGTFDLNGFSQTVGAVNGDGGTILLNSATLTIGATNRSGSFAGTIEAPGALVKIGTGVQALRGTNTYAGGTSILGGVLDVADDANLGAAAGGVTIGGAALRISGTSFGTFARAVTLNADGGTIDVADATHTLTMTTGIAGAGSFTKTGLGTLLFTTANAYQGDTTLAQGVLRVSADDQLGVGGALLFDGGDLQIDGTSYLASSRAVQLLGGGGRVIVADILHNFTLNTTLAGVGTLTKAGSGTLTLQAGNTYTGGTRIETGILAIAADSALGDAGRLAFVGVGATLQVTADTLSAREIDFGSVGGTFDVGAGVVYSLEGNVIGAGGLLKTGAGELLQSNVATSNFNYSGATTIADGILRISRADALPVVYGLNIDNAGQFQLNGNNQSLSRISGISGAAVIENQAATAAVLTVGATGLDSDFAGRFLGNLSVVKEGGGLMTLTGDGDIAGTLTLNAGTVVVDAAMQLAGITVNSGAVLTGYAQGAGESPFGTTNDILLSGGTLRLIGLTTTTNTLTTGALQVAGGSRLIVDATAGGSTTFSAGSLVRVGNGTLQITAGSGSLNVTEFFHFANPGVGPGTIIPWISNSAGDFITVDAGNFLVVAQPSAAVDINDDAFGLTSFYRAEAGKINQLNANRAWLGLVVDQQVVNGAFTLSIGDGTTAAKVNLLGGSIDTTNLNFGASEAIITTTAAPASISAVIQGSGGLTKLGGQTLTLSGNNTYVGGTSFNGGTVFVFGDENLGAAGEALRFDGGTLRTGGTFTLTRPITIGAGSGTIGVDGGSSLSETPVLTIDQNMTGSGSLTKIGAGTLVLAQGNSFAGGLTVTEGTARVLNSESLAGADAVVGANPLGTGPLTLNGGRLEVRINGDGTTAAQNLLFDNDLLVGADSVLSLDRVSGAATTKTVQFKSLLVQGSTFTVTPANSFGLQILGSSTIRGVSTLNVTAGTMTLSGVLTGSGALTKAGAGTLTITNTASGVDANNFTGTVDVFQGTLNAYGTGSSFALAGASAVRMSGGTFRILHDGDGTATTTEDIDLGLDLEVFSGPASTIYVDRLGTTAARKNVEIRSLTFREDSRLITTGANTYRIGITGPLTLAGNAYFDVSSADVILHGPIVDADGFAGGTLNKFGSAVLWVNGVSTHRGGTAINGGTVIFGDKPAGTADATVYNPDSRLGPGAILVNPGAALRLAAATNIHPGQRVDLVGSQSSLPLLGLRTINSLSEVNFRAFTGGVVGINTSGYDRIDDMRLLGDGTWFLGSNDTGTYTGVSLIAGAGNMYRLGGGGNVLTIANPNVLTGAADLSVGTGLVRGGLVTNSNGNIIFNGEQSYTGRTTVHKGSTSTIGNTLEFRATLATPEIEVLGRLTANVFGTFVRADGTGNRNDVVLRPGGALRFDYTSTTAGASVDKWHDGTPIHLPGSALELIGRNATSAVTSERVGDVTFGGGSVVLVQESATSAQAELILAELTRVGQGTITFTRGGASAANIGGVGNDTVRLIVAGGAPTVTNGMVAPYFVNGTDGVFLTYGANGFAGAAFSATSLTASTATDIVNVTSAETLSGTAEAYAVKATAGISGGTLQIGSGGLLTTSSITVGSAIEFGGPTPTEAVIYNSTTLNLTGALTAAGFTKSGAGRLTITGANPGITAGAEAPEAQVNGGVLQLQNANSLGGLAIRLAGSSLSATTLELRADAHADFTSSVVLDDNVPLATINVDRISSAGGTAKNLTIPRLTFNTNSGAGQTLIVSTNSSNLFRLNVSEALQLNSTDGGGTVTLALNTSAEIMIVDGVVSGLARLHKTDVNNNTTLILAGVNTYTGGTTLSGGTLDARGLQALGTGDVDLIAGTLILRNDVTGGTFGFGAGFDVNVLGNVTINVNRTAGSATSQTLSINNLNIGNQVLTTTASNSYRLGINGDINLSGDATINASSAPVLLAGGINGGGRDYSLTKIGATEIQISGAATDFTGGTFIDAGTVRMMNATATLGGGDVFVNGSGRLILHSLPNFENIAGGQRVVVTSTEAALAVIGLGDAINVSPVGATGFNLESTTSGLLAVNGGSYGQDVVASLGDGTWYLGATSSGTYNGSVLTAGAGNLYRLGGGGATLTLLAASNNLLTGDNSVVVGSLLLNGNSGGVVFNNTNNYAGDTLINRGVTATLVSGGTNSPLGGGTVDVFGGLALSGTNGSFLDNTAALATGNRNVIRLHPGAVLTFGASSNTNRWFDSAPVALDGAQLSFAGNSNTTSTETFGALTYTRGATLTSVRSSTNGQTQLTFADLTRGGVGDTLTVTVGSATSLGSAAALGDRILIDAFASAAPVDALGMLSPSMINATAGNFLTYDSTLGLSNAAFTTTSLPTAAATDIAFQTGSATLTSNVTVHALRITSTSGTATISNTLGVADRITIRSGGLLTTGSTSALIVVNPSLVFGDDGEKEALIYNSGTVTLNGRIVAGGGITKFGGGVLVVNAPQTHSAGWFVNGGTLQVQALDGLGTADASNTVVLNGGSSVGSTLTFHLNTGNAADATFTSGKIISWDNNRINFTFGSTDDRTATIADIDLNATAGNPTSVLTILTERSRTSLNTGLVTLNADARLIVDATSYTGGGISTSVTFAGLAGVGRTLTKVGDGTLGLNDNGATFVGGRIFVGEGTLRVNSDGSLGDATGTATFQRNGVLEINVDDFNPLATVVQQVGSLERWSVEGARGGVDGDYTVPDGVILQLDTSLQGTRTITLGEGSAVEGYLRQDNLVWTTFRTAGPNVSWQLAGDARIGQTVEGQNIPNGEYPQTSFANTFTPEILLGAVLEIQGAISGSGNLTKVGDDMVILSGANTYGDTTIAGGMLRIGRDDALPTSGRLAFAGGSSGAFDLNGFDQTVDVIHGPAGIIGNSAAQINTLTFGGSGQGSYGGTVQGGVALAKTGSGTQVLTGANTYVGTTNVSGGTLTVNGSIAGGGVSVSGGMFNGGSPTTPAQINTGVVVNAGGGFSAGSNSAGFEGNGVGQMNIAGNLVWNDSSNLVFDFRGVDNLGTDWDFVHVGGTLQLAATTSITLYVDSWLADNSDYGGNTFDAMPEPVVPTSWQWLMADGGITNGFGTVFGDQAEIALFNVVDNRSGTGVFAGDGGGYSPSGRFWVSSVGSALFINYQAVPEPGSLMLLAVAGLGVAFRYRRKLKSGIADKGC